MEEFKRKLETLLEVGGYGVPLVDFTQGILILVNKVEELEQENKDLRSRLEEVENIIDFLRNATGI